MDGQSTCRFCLVLLATVVAVCAQDIFLDFSRGMIEGIETNCNEVTKGVWKEENATQYFVEGSPGPQEGKVIVSQTKTVSCIRMPNGPHNITEDFKIKVYLFVPDTSQQHKLYVFFVGKDDVAKGVSTSQPTTAGWKEVEISVPKPNTLTIPYPGPYTVELWTTDTQFIALRWFGVSDKEMPFPPVSTTENPSTADSTVESTTENSEIETTTAEFSSMETTTDYYDASSSTIETSPTTKRTTLSPPQSTIAPSQLVFPDIWSLLLGIVIGIILTSLVVFVSTCFWWVWGAQGKKITVKKDPAFVLPRLEVVSSSSQGSIITGSVGSQISSIDPFWVKSKGWAHIP